MVSWFAIAVLSPKSVRAGFCLQGGQRASPDVVKLERTNFLRCLDMFGQVAFLKALPLGQPPRDDNHSSGLSSSGDSIWELLVKFLNAQQC